MLPAIRWTALGLIVFLMAGWLALSVAGSGPSGRALEARLASFLGLSPPAASSAGFGLGIGGPFRLTDDTGRTVTDASFRGRWMLVYFGYTSCPDVCPTELATIAAALHDLGADADRVAALFITVDPARDTPKVLAAYVRLFDRRLIGLTGTPAQIAATARAYRAYYQKVASGDRNAYHMDHSSFIYLMGPDGGFEDLFNPGTRAADIAASIRSRIARSS
ncbi:MAG TPA: SCO family protein [Acetobacteraceae bacterium]|jgi:cytochrome oxidase Cu insertion factor (SCO1/SenC/PrrC family)|nr:SCO family protein [Acetobacteraceae bacterium]